MSSQEDPHCHFKECERELSDTTSISHNIDIYEKIRESLINTGLFCDKHTRYLSNHICYECEISHNNTEYDSDDDYIETYIDDDEDILTKIFINI